MGRDQTEKLPCRTSARGWKRESELYSMADGFRGGGKRAENGGRKGGREENQKKKRESFFPFL